MKKTLPLVSIVISNHNGKKYLDKCIASLKKLEYPQNRIEIIVSDNASTDGSAGFIKRRYPGVIIGTNSENNYCKGVNLAIRMAKGKFIALINNDTKVAKKWLIELIKIIESGKRIGAVGSKVLFMDGKINSTGHREYPGFYWGDRGFREKDDGKYNNLEEVPSISGCCVLYRKRCLDDVGLLDEDFIMYMEDVDMSLRCRKKGWKLVYVPKSIIYHVFHGTATKELADYYVERNRLLLIAKYYPTDLAKLFSGRGYFTKHNFKKLNETLPAVIAKLVKNDYKAESIEDIVSGLFKELGRLDNYQEDYFYEDTDKLKERDLEIRARDKRLEEKDGLLEEKDQLIKERDMLIKEKDILISNKDKEYSDKYFKLLDEKDWIIKERDILIKEKDSLLLNKDKESRDKDFVRAEKEKEIILKDQKIYNLNAELAKELELFQAQKVELQSRGDLVREKEAVIEQRDKEIDERSQVIIQKDAIIIAQNKDLNAKTTEIAKLNTEIVGFSSELKLQQKETELKEKTIANLLEKIDLMPSPVHIKSINMENEKLRLTVEDSLKEIQSLKAQIGLLDSMAGEKNKTIHDMQLKIDGLCKVECSVYYRFVYSPMANLYISIKKLIDKARSLLSGIRVSLKTGFQRMSQSLRKNRIFMKFYDSNNPLSKILQALQRRKNKWLSAYVKHIRTGSGIFTPETLLLMLTKRCNLRCEFCDIRDSSEEMKTEDAIKVIENVKGLGIRLLVITGGEPFLHKDLFKIVKYAKNLGLEVCVTTNGSLILDRLTEIGESMLDTLSVSLDGIENAHDKMRGREGLFKKVQQGIEGLRNHNCTVALNFVLTNRNIDQLEKVYLWAKERRLFFDFWPVNYCKDLYINQNGDYRVLANFVKRLRHNGEIKKDKYYYFRKVPLYLRDDVKLRVRCLGLSRQIGVDVNGNVTPCCVWDKKSINLGNATEDDMGLLWNSRKYYQVRRDIFHKGCGDGCYNNSLHEFMTITGYNFIINSEKKKS